MKSRNDILERAGKQLSSPVLWNDCVKRALSLGIEEFVEIGPKPVLSGLFKGSSKSVPAKFFEFFQHHH